MCSLLSPLHNYYLNELFVLMKFAITKFSCINYQIGESKEIIKYRSRIQLKLVVVAKVYDLIWLK